MKYLFVIVLSYFSIAVFLIGVAIQVLKWARSAVPFRIPTTSGQQKSLPWIRSGWLESPHTGLGVIARMALEVLLFRSLFRNHRSELRGGGQLSYREEKSLWLGAMTFHWSLLLICIRHLRLFLEPVPRWILGLQNLDGYFQIGSSPFLITDGVILVSLTFLLLRRLCDARIRYISLFADYFSPALLLGVAGTGVWMRYFEKVDLMEIKEFALGLVVFAPRIPANAGMVFFLHLFLVCLLLACFPFTKLMHMAGIFLSPTRNLANNSRMKRHVNPWDSPVKIHTYEEWEHEFSDKIRAAGLPLEGK